MRGRGGSPTTSPPDAVPRGEPASAAGPRSRSKRRGLQPQRGPAWRPSPPIDPGNLAVGIPETTARNQRREPYRSRPVERISGKPRSSMVIGLAPPASARSGRAVIAWRRCPSVSLASWCSRSDLWSCKETRACRPRPPAGSAPAAPTFTRMVRGPTRSAGSGRLPPSNQRYAVWGWIPWRRAYSVRSTSADEHIRTGSRGMLSGTSSQPLPRPASRGAGRPHPGAHSGVGGRPAELARRHQLLAWRGPQPPIRAPHPCVTGQPAGRRDRDHPLWGP